MKLDEAKAAFYEATETLSETTRKLLFAGIAIVWIFKTGDKTAAGIAFSHSLLLPLGAFVVGLVLDMFQYLYKSTVWWLYYNYKHWKRLSDDTQVAPPRWINVITFVFFNAKVAACAWGFYYLVKYIWEALNHVAGA